MAQRTVVTLIDDLDGSEADSTVEFGLDGVSYEIDLSDANADNLRDYIARARRVTGRRSSRPSSRRTASTGNRGSSGTASVDREQNKAIREWARTAGYEVSERGRIPSTVVQAFHSRQ